MTASDDHLAIIPMDCVHFKTPHEIVRVRASALIPMVFFHLFFSFRWNAPHESTDAEESERIRKKTLPKFFSTTTDTLNC